MQKAPSEQTLLMESVGAKQALLRSTNFYLRRVSNHEHDLQMQSKQQPRNLKIH